MCFEGSNILFEAITTEDMAAFEGDLSIFCW